MTLSNQQRIRDNLKHQTRRLDHLKEINQDPDKWVAIEAVRVIPPVKKGGYIFQYTDGHCVAINPRYQIGETVYIKEAHYLYGVWAYLTADQDKPMPQREWRFVQDLTYPVKYLENPPDRVERNRYGGNGWYLRSPLFLKAEYARDFIHITGVKLGRLQDISEEDAKVEGAREMFTIDNPQLLYPDVKGYRRGFLFLWDSINKKYPWGSNPWEWGYTFRLIEKSEVINKRGE